jgi:hypothetical protein
MSKKLGYAAAGAALGAAAVLLANKENRAKLKKKAQQLKDLAAKEGAKLGEKAKDLGVAIEKEAKVAGKKIVKASATASRKAKAAVKAARATK